MKIIDNINGTNDLNKRVTNIEAQINGIDIKEINALMNDIKKMMESYKKMEATNRTLASSIIKSIRCDSYELKRIDILNKFFSNEGGFLSIMSRAIGFIKCRIQPNINVDKNLISSFVSLCIGPINNNIIILQENLNNLDKEIYNDIQNDIKNIIENSSADIMVNNLQTYQDNLYKEKYLKHNYIFYTNLWHNVEPFIKLIEMGIFDDIKEEEPTIARNNILKFLHYLSKAIELSDIIIANTPNNLPNDLKIKCSNCEENYFLTLSEIKFPTPLIIRKFDEFVYVKGVMTKQQ